MVTVALVPCPRTPGTSEKWAGRPRGLRRDGAIFAALGFVALIMGAFVLVINVAGQATMTRSVSIAALQGRYALEMAESAVDECLADFSTVISQVVSQRDLYSHIRSEAAGGVVTGEAVMGVSTLTYTAVQTPKIMSAEGIDVRLSDVSVRPVYYGTVNNYGEVELCCQASYKLGKRELFRRVTARHYITLDVNGKTFRVNPVPCRFVVDRSREE